MSDFTPQVYRSPGPVASAFLEDRANTVRFLMGPFGSGKTNVNLFDKLKCAREMPKCTRGPWAGNRLYRHIELRDTYANLWSSTIKSWWQWFGPDVGKWSGAENRQATHELRFDMPDGGMLVFEIVFQAIQDADIEAALRGREFTTLNMGEADLMGPEVLTYAATRAVQQRFPPKRFFEDGQSYYTGVTGDLNPPDMDNWIFNIFEEVQPVGHKLYKQPSGRGPHGENRQAMPRERYEQMAVENAHDPGFVRRMVDGQFGYSREGEPVLPEYVDDRNCAGAELAPVPGLPIRLGFDQGIRGPAMAVVQWLPNGQVRALDEFAPGRIGPTGFGRECRLLLEQRYRNVPIEHASGDQAGFFGGDVETGDKAMLEIVAEIMGVTILPTETRDPEYHRDAIRQLLRYSIDGRQPGLLISPRCKMLRKAFNSHYRYRKRRGYNAGSDPKPEKNEFADVMEAFMFAVFDLVGMEGVKRGLLMGGRGDRLRLASDEDDDAPAWAQPQTDFDVWRA